MAANMMKVVAVALAALLVLAVPRHAEAAVTCGQVASSLGPCLSSITGGGPPSSACCAGVKSLYGATKASRPDRLAACGCIKNQLGALGSKASPGALGSLPGKCGVSLGFTPSVNINCNSIP